MQSATEADFRAADAHERASVFNILKAAEHLRLIAESQSAGPPKFVLQSARTMANCLGMSDQRVSELLPSMALWQAYLPSALTRDQATFTQAHTLFPRSYRIIHNTLSEMQLQPQFVIAIFHNAGLPLVAALLGAVSTELHLGRCHALVAPRNMALLNTEGGRWVLDYCEPICANRAGLRQLISGLRVGAIRRLLILADGPHQPGGPGMRALTGISQNMAFKTGLLTSIVSMGIPIRPLVHYWKADELVLDWWPILSSENEAVNTTASLIESLLQKHPEQWLNWSAPSLRK
jgi:hypothetical protein